MGLKFSGVIGVAIISTVTEEVLRKLNKDNTADLVGDIGMVGVVALSIKIAIDLLVPRYTI